MFCNGIDMEFVDNFTQIQGSALRKTAIRKLVRSVEKWKGFANCVHVLVAKKIELNRWGWQRVLFPSFVERIP